MGRIRLLDTLVKSRIAAGEVVENPASVVKELVENSIDAAATTVDIEIAGGGAGRIRVTDNGSGLFPEDVPLAVEHFATSKIERAEDIFGIATYGFRGEALASISAVSRFTLTTRRRELNEGALLRVLEKGKKRVQPAGAPPGTTVLVEDLFYSLPVRRKFLKSDRAETAKVVDAVLRTALFRPEVSFSLRSEKRTLLELPARKKWIERVADCLGNDVAAGLVPIEPVEGSAVRVRGLLGKPSLHRHNRTAIFTAVGSRPVHSKELLNAIIVGYRGLLPERRFPVAVVSIEVPPRYVDINVHPQKKEARFRDAQSVGRMLRREISLAFLGRGKAEEGKAVPEAVKRSRPPSSVEAPSETSRPETGPASQIETPGKPVPEKAPGERFDLWHGAMKIPPIPHPPPPTPDKGGKKLAATPTAPPAPSPAEVASPEESREGAPVDTDKQRTEAAKKDKTLTGDFLYIGQTSEGYMIVETGGAIRIVDPHALHERMIYEKLKKREGQGEMLKMLFPVVVSLSAREMPHKDALVEVMKKIGFEVDEFGPSDIAVTAVPSAFEGGDPAGVGRDVLDALSAGGEAAGSDAAEQVLNKALASASCHAAVKLGKRFSEEEAVAFLKDAARLGAVQVCPHGRATSVDIDLTTIKGRLSR